MNSFTVNGRFLSQKTTGVQRYATEITRRLGAVAMADARLSGSLVFGDGASAAALAGLKGHHAPGRADPIWEQTKLPRHSSGHLLCFGNTGPLAYRDKTVCIHDANLRLEPQSYSLAFRTYMSILTPLVVRSARHITTVSSYSADMLRRTGICRRDEIRVAPNGHEHALAWDAGASRVAETYHLRRPFVLLVGSLARHKNWKLIAGIGAELDAAGLDIVACGAGGAEFSGLGDDGFSRFRMLGRISDDDLAWLYRNAVCLAFPSLVEGFGIPIVEAMALGCPVIASNVSVMPSIGGTAAILLDPQAPLAWRDAIFGFAQLPDLRSEYVGRGLERVTEFSWDRSAAVYLDIVTS